jgi:hypothetical protein
MVALEEVLCMPNVTSSAITLVASKTFLVHHIFNEDEQGIVKLLKGDKLNKNPIKVCSFVFP